MEHADAVLNFIKDNAQEIKEICEECVDRRTADPLLSFAGDKLSREYNNITPISIISGFIIQKATSEYLRVIK